MLPAQRRRKHIWDQSIWTLFWKENTFLNQINNESCKCVYLYDHHSLENTFCNTIFTCLLGYEHSYLFTILYKSNIVINLKAVHSEIACNHDNSFNTIRCCWFLFVSNIYWNSIRLSFIWKRIPIKIVTIHVWIGGNQEYLIKVIANVCEW